MIDLLKGDCLELMRSIPSGSIDAIITDPPYGTTACKWDSVIDFELMWEQLNRIIKPNGAIVLFGSEPFSSALRMSNIKNYKYDWVWEKKRGTNIFQAKKAPLKNYENIIVFSDGNINAQGNMIYYPQGLKDCIIERSENNKGNTLGYRNKKDFIQNKKGYPKSVQYFDKDKSGHHPTQKPIALMEYLIKTYTNENETVLDFTMGSGSTGVACKNTNRNFIGIEQDENYFKIATERIEENKMKLF